MSRHRNVDWVAWHLYRRAWAICALASVAVLAAGIRPQSAPESPLPPSFSDEQASGLIDRARLFEKAYPDRRPGTSGSLDSAQWVQKQFDELGLSAQLVPHTTLTPASIQPISLTNVEASLRGRSGETVVIFAHRDNSGARDQGSGGVETIALLELARGAIATRDRRRSYVFVSTDGATQGSAGARVLADRLIERGSKIVAVVGLDRIDQGGLQVPWSPAGDYAQPLGLTRIALDAVDREGGDGSAPGLVTQLLSLATPITLFEQGQIVRQGLPVITIAGRADHQNFQPQPTSDSARRDVGAAMRATQRVLLTLDTVDTLQSAGKTYVIGDRRAFRGWTLKVLLATLLLPFWIAVVDLLARQLRRGGLETAVGSAVRAMIGGVWALASLWLLAAAGVLPKATDTPPNPATLSDAPVTGLVVWLLLTVAGWTLVRAPDWRHYVSTDAEAMADRDRSALAVCLVTCGMLAVLALAVDPYAVLFALVPLHVWLLLASRRVRTTASRVGVWAAGCTGPLAAVVVVAARFNVTPIDAPWYALNLVQTRTLPAGLALLFAAAAGLAGLTITISLGKFHSPFLVRTRTWTLPELRLPSIRRFRRRA